MAMRKSSHKGSRELMPSNPDQPIGPYSELLTGVVRLIEEARLVSVRSVNAVLTSTYWLVGQRIVEHEQSGTDRAAYGQTRLTNLARDLCSRLGRGFSERNLEQMRAFYLNWSNPQTLSAESAPVPILQTVSAKSDLWPRFPLPWSHYVRLLSVSDAEARAYYEREALVGGWSVRQLDRQIASLAYQRTRGTRAPRQKENEPLPPDGHVRDPFVLEFLNLKDEYSESDLENALIDSLEQFLLELGNDFAFVARQKRLRIGTEWYRVDLVLFHRRLRSLIIVEILCGRPHNAEHF
jgi:predicted nuclease of restriction endonuclease-like (RecB) superfamily